MSRESLSLAYGIDDRPPLAEAIPLGLQHVAHFPDWARTFFGSGLITGGLTALVLNLVLPPSDDEG